MPKESPHSREQFDGLIGEGGMDVVFAVRDVLPEEALGKDLLGLGVALIDVILFVYYLILLADSLVRMDYVVIVLVELIERLVYFRGEAVVAAHSLRDALVLVCLALVAHDEDQIESGQK